MTDYGFEHLLRELAPQVLGAILRRYRDFPAAEDALQEALVAAATQWPLEGVPENPRAWLTQVASRRMIDQIRTDSARRQRETAAAMEAGYAIPAPDSAITSNEDDTLILIYMCCHPALTTSSAIALTLRAVGGLTTAEIAHAFLVPETTMAQRISRAKQTIRESGVPFKMPVREDQHQRLSAVLHVLYLIFNEGYTASQGEQLQRADLAAEAIRLARVVYTKLPGDAEVAGLLALMLLTDARRAARCGPHNEVIPLDKQDRTLWDRTQIEEGAKLISAALPRGAVGPYQLQAAIAAVHDESATANDTDWPQILALYSVLKRMVDNPMVTLNHAVAAAMVHGPAEGLRLIAELDASDRLRNHHRLHAVRGHLLEMAQEFTAAIENYQAAAARTASLPERNYLLAQAARLRDRQGP
uniref:Putative RNA polymerase, sigma-24 subunit, ECF subfamily n=1 Tax=Solibacter usitatus (strain Ellin6076) TaxID=234267 RepID=Q020I1_SOLUE